ncbi:hypothetical protein [Maribellus sp. YY47]|uniref:hypothetical protein n=1 Tax=Maribellus sp. YY47 TaxID=2929486 RepID=UPI0020008252|nr:hypothetical protein [Maribellus sp. YY47]MCK3682803.1 hypothetical protein [Maribellus sp. YY47]
MKKKCKSQNLLISDQEWKEIEALESRSPEKDALELQRLRDKAAKEADFLKWIKSFTKELDNKGREAKSVEEINLVGADLGRFISFVTDYFVTLKNEGGFMGSIPKDQVLEKVESAIMRLRGIKEMIDGRREYLNSNKSIDKPQKEFWEYLSGAKRKKHARWLKKEFLGEKGKGIAIMILGLENKGKIRYDSRKDLYTSIGKYFGYTLNKSSIDKYLSKTSTDHELLVQSGKIETFVAKLSQKKW